MNFSRKYVVSFLFVIAACAMTAFAVPRPDIQAKVVGPATPMVNSPYVYTASAKNIGNQRADSIVMTISLPLSNTSPQKFILGQLSGFPTNQCQLTNNQLRCVLGNLNQNQTKSISFTYKYPVSTKPLSIKNDLTTTSTNELVTSNNSFTLAPTLNYPVLEVTSAHVLVSHCTGTNLTSFAECEAFPSSIASFEMDLNSDQSITIPVAPSYVGSWDQFTSNKQLHFLITDPSDGSGAEFNGFASSTTCFDGITNFIPSSPYSSPYRVCIQ